MHPPSIPRARSSGKRIFSIPLAVSAALCVSLIAAATITLAEVVRYKQLQLAALLVLSRWQNMDTLTNDVLLKRVSLSDGGALALLGEWERQSLEFSLALARFNDERNLAPLGDDMIADVRGAAELWSRTERRISAAQEDIRAMIRSGLGSRVMVNGFLSTFYRLRLEGLLEEKEIVQIDEIIASLSFLDTTTDQFGQRLKAVVQRVGEVADSRILRVLVMSVVLAPAGGFLAVFLVLFYRRFRREDRRRKKEALRLRRDFLRDFYSRISASAAAGVALKELGVSLPFSRDLHLCFLRYDRSNADGAENGQEHLLEAVDLVSGPEREFFPFDDGIVAVLFGRTGGENAEAFAKRLRTVAEAEGKTVSVALSEAFDGEEGGMAFDALVSLFSYRYIYGPRAFLQEAGLPPRREGVYEYPGEGDEFIIKRILEGNLDEARARIDATLEAAAGYSPATARAAVARLSSALFSAIERLERAVSFALPSVSADSLAELVLLDTVSAVRDRFARLLAEIADLMDSHQGQRTSAQVDRVDSIIATDFAEPNLSLELIAERLGLSPGHIGRVYRKIRGKSVAETINDARVEAARVKLEDTDATIEAIAAEIGITNPGSFYRLFKARHGLTPADYRERARFALAGWSGPRNG